ncbi:flagella cluster protein [Halobiforma lacisalsi AJ5]|uniref:Flagella cluster protein n=1 Tax=Natronobacterium lacisalsi AJ5 TaxID=358396 RepID=M0M1P0_NATLA|nr:hypothetical protein [Halobiforma lacisalsi]APW97385.1 flagella cluster protein [Halobiforma lacisalsi AJ5]EMA38320.1 flagella cluster protein [Halobiforma lacisalsi AJ5]
MTERNEDGNPKDNADVPPVLPSEQSSSEAGGVLSPEDLDISDSPYVSEISEGRYVVSADRSPPNAPDKSDSLPTRESPSAGSGPDEETDLEAGGGGGSGGARGGRRGQGRGQGQGQGHPSTHNAPTEPNAGASSPRRQHQPVQSPETARSILADELDRVDARYAVDIVSRFGDETVRHRMTSDDVLDTFNSLVFWYARNVARDTRTDRAASLLFAKSDFDAPLSEPQLRAALREHDLDESSSIGELLEALE